jgi:hypothetical protein
MELQVLEKEALSKEEDTAQKGMTWFLTPTEIAFADAEKREVKRFPKLFDYDNLSVSGFAFAADKVWVGTNKGLIAWDRGEGFWSRFAVGGTLVEAPVRDVALGEGGKLAVTIQEEGQKPRKFAYDAEAKPARWTELP